MDWLKQKIEERSTPVPIAGCWLWTAGVDSTGYGTLYLGGGRKLQNAPADLDARTGRGAAHVLAWRAWNGGLLVPPGMVVMHACDTRCCVYHGHLSVGTYSTNLAEAWARVRARKPLSMNTGAVYQRRSREKRRAHTHT
jgi:hypothetical protein